MVDGELAGFQPTRSMGRGWLKEVALTQNKFALVDDEDYEEISKNKWYFCKYAVRTVGGKKIQRTIWMHRFIMGLGYESGDIYIDHADGDKLNNQKYNLRICTQTDNVRNGDKRKHNTSGYKGAREHSQAKGKFVAQISYKGICNYIGLFDDVVEAAIAYDESARKYFGEFARLNFPREGEMGVK